MQAAVEGAGDRDGLRRGTRRREAAARNMAVVVAGAGGPRAKARKLPRWPVFGRGGVSVYRRQGRKCCIYVIFRFSMCSQTLFVYYFFLMQLLSAADGC